MTHYTRWRRHGDPLHTVAAVERKPKRTRTADEVVAEIMSKVVVAPSGCWEVTRNQNARGYGRVMWNGKTRAASRVMYEIHYEVVLPADVYVCHRCDNPPCCRPDHLYAGSPADNFRDMVLADRGNSIAQRSRSRFT